MLLLEYELCCGTDPGQQPYGLQEALSVRRVEDPYLQQVLVFHHVATLQSYKNMAAFTQHFLLFPEKQEENLYADWQLEER